MLVTLARYFDPWEAHVLRARLESEGIPATVTGDQHIIANWPSAPFPTRASRFQCASCGHAWRYGDNALTPGE